VYGKPIRFRLGFVSKLVDLAELVFAYIGLEATAQWWTRRRAQRKLEQEVGRLVISRMVSETDKPSDPS